MTATTTTTTTTITTTAAEAGDYESAMSRAGVEVVRTGRGYGPNVVRNLSFDGVEMVSGLVQFPVHGKSNVPDGNLAVVLSVVAPPGSRWCEIDLVPGTMLIYGPGALHTAATPAGAEYRYALIEEQRLDETAESLRLRIRRPSPGSLGRVPATAHARKLASVLERVGNPLSAGDDHLPSAEDLLYAMAGVLADPSPPQPLDAAKVASQQVVSDCIDFAESIGRIPSIPELCGVAHVSERRLRGAFYDTYDSAPNSFFRARFLSHARDRLLETDGHGVTEVALDLGFDHLSRFAGQYERTYGELPHETSASRATRST